MRSSDKIVREYLEQLPSNKHLSIADARFLIATLTANDFRRCIGIGRHSQPACKVIKDVARLLGMEISVRCIGSGLAIKPGNSKLDLIVVGDDVRHPIPLVQTMLALPHLRLRGVILCQDLRRASQSDKDHGNGPRLLYGSVHAENWKCKEPGAAIGAIRFNRDARSFEADFLRALNLPWELSGGFPVETVALIDRRISANYSEKFAGAVRKILHDHKVTTPLRRAG